MLIVTQAVASRAGSSDSGLRRRIVLSSPDGSFTDGSSMHAGI
jgi:hypothetical protein